MRRYGKVYLLSVLGASLLALLPWGLAYFGIFPMALALDRLSVPFAGRSGFRLIGYAWPLFWIAIPYFHFRQIESRRDPKWTSGE